MSDIILIVTVGTGVFLLLGVFISFMALLYQRKRMEHVEHIKGLEATYQTEILKAQVEMQEHTFLTISQEIHDNVGQLLSLVRLNVSTLASSQEEASAQKIQSSKDLLDEAIEELRTLSRRLNSKFTSQQSLASLIGGQLGFIQKTGVLDTEFNLVGEERWIDPEKKLIVFRIAQEAIQNVLRHAGATLLTIQITHLSEKMTVSIADNGKGYASPALPLEKGTAKGTGTQNMHFRAKLVGASLSIQGLPEAGTLVVLELPYN